MEDADKRVIDFIRNRNINELKRLYVDRNSRKEYITYNEYKKLKNDFESKLTQKESRLGTLLCNFVNCNFQDIKNVKNFIEDYSITLLSDITKIEFKNIYFTKEYEDLVDIVVNDYSEKIQNIRKDFIDDINYVFNIEQLEEIKELTPLLRFYVLRKKGSKTISYFENSDIHIADGNLQTLENPCNFLDEDSLIDIALGNKDRILPIPYTFESKNILALLVLELKEIVCMDKFEIKKCKNCGKYFVPEKRTDELYCNNIYEDEKTCKEVGGFRVKQKLMQEDDALRVYRNVYQKLLLRTRRNPTNTQYENEFQQFKDTNREMREKLDKGTITYEEYVEWLNTL